MKKINKILIANRGEIASRIIRTCKKMGITSIAVFSDADRDAPFVREADMAVHIGESSPQQSYLDQEKILEIAKQTTADAIHPGYGFLSENSAFAKKCAENNIIFIGPNPAAIQAMGSKSEAKEMMLKNKVPVVPGYNGKDQSADLLKKEAEKIGFPVLLKATAGGGGKGMRIVNSSGEFSTALETAKREAKSAFGDDEMIVEKYIASGRHIEFQIFGDQHGNVIHLLERECTIQRRYQKVIEESPSPVLTDELRNIMGASAVHAAKALNYDNAGTVEFIFDEKSQQYYFLEVNTRLQVEHPVTEAITGLDLVQMQIESAMGMPLRIQQNEVRSNGYAIEARLYAEDATNNFTPVTGLVSKFKVPNVEGLRVDSAIESGSEISVFYDPMIAKLIMWDQNREAAQSKMTYVLKQLVCQGTVTNQNFLLSILQNQEFQQGKYDTHFVSEKINLKEVGQQNEEAKIKAGIAATLSDWSDRNEKRTLLKGLPSGWRNSFYKNQFEKFKIEEEEIEVTYRYVGGQFSFQIKDQNYKASIIEATTDKIRIEINGIQQTFSIAKNGNQYDVHNEDFGNVVLNQLDRFPVKEKEKVKGGYEAPMPSQVVKVLAKKGQKVEIGTPLVIITSMKMENTIAAEEDGVVEEVYATAGNNVEAGFLLMKINPTT